MKYFWSFVVSTICAIMMLVGCVICITTQAWWLLPFDILLFIIDSIDAVIEFKGYRKWRDKNHDT